MKRVVVTGMGAVTPLGHSVAETWDAVMNGRSGIAGITHFDASGFSSRIAGEVKNFDATKLVAADPRLRGAMSNSLFAIAASEEAVKDSGLDWDNLDERSKGVYFAAGDSAAPVESLARAFAESFGKGKGEFDAAAYLAARLAGGDGAAEAQKEPAATLAHLVRRYGIRGPALNCLTACAASAQGIGEGAAIIRRGEAAVVLSGGAHSMIHPLGVAGFCLLTALSTHNEEPEKASRPFDATRNGFVLSEGAGAVILEEFEHARKRGARIYGELVGYGSTADAYRLTDSHPEGLGAIASLREALEGARVNPAEVDYLNAHGTSTKVNDAVESLAIRSCFGPAADQLWVSSTKSMTGHLIAAAGAVELQFCLLAMRDGVVPPTINYSHRDPACDLDYVPNEARKKAVRVAVSDSFGFGGQNVVLVAKKL
ncbi:MAG: beta-ketoacyl-[acyl-carrier-protein] synthase family protein [Candidatus Omnitrophica bacterium]|nr:beta-ketoacyl-[acyl-carrier-protein] synthase family protein [Candidatus Omnitrophota bacterium]